MNTVIGSIDMTRRGFLADLAAFMGIGTAGGLKVFAAPEGWQPSGTAKLVFGVLSDTHLRTDYKGIGLGKYFPDKYLLSALKYFRDENVDAVVHCGDMADRGQIRELEFHARAFEKVFPGGLAPDGHKVEKLIVAGNHEIVGHTYNIVGGFDLEAIFPDPAVRAKHVIATDVAGCWERVWGEKYEPVWHKEVKGYHFFGRHYGVGEMDLARLVRGSTKKYGLSSATTPFFVLSHIRSHAKLNRFMAKYPNALSFFGHWHHSASNWNEIHAWGGAVAVQVPACAPTKSILHLGNDSYISKAKLEGGGKGGLDPSRQGYVVKVYDDLLTISRREFGQGGSLGPDWILPLGKSNPHPFSKDELKKVVGKPEFKPDAKLAVEKTENGIRLSIPSANANPNSRVYAYEVNVAGDKADTPPLVKAIYAKGVNLGIGHEPNGGTTTLEISVKELPKCKTYRISATPLSSLGTRGSAITST